MKKEMVCRFYKIDKVLSILLTDNKYFEIYKCIEYLEIVIGEDYSKGVFIILLTICIKIIDGV